MNPDLLLGVVTALAGFVLKTTLAFGVCLGLGWLADSPSRRFLVWLSFLYGTAAYWLWLTKGVLASGQLSASTTNAVAQPVTSTVGALQIPGSWAFPLGVALRVIGIVYLLVLTYMLVAHIRKHPAAEMDSGLHQSTAGRDRRRFSATGGSPSCGAFKIAGTVGGYVAGNVRLDSTNHRVARCLPRTGPL